MERLDEAMTCFDKVIEIDSKDPDGWYNKSCIQIYMGLIDEGLDNLEKSFRFGGREFKELAKEEALLENVRDNSRFLSMIK